MIASDPIQDAPDSVGVYDRALDVRVYYRELVGIDLSSTEDESKGVLVAVRAGI